MDKLFEALEGRWKLQRKINPSIIMHVDASFSKLGEGLLFHYQEEGIVYLANIGKSYKAYRSYVYAYEHG